MATIACKCGKCQIRLSTTAPRVQTVCCCADCYNRFNVLHKQKDGPSPQNHNLPAILYSYENSLRIESGDIYFYKLDVNNDRPSMLPRLVAIHICLDFMPRIIIIV